MEVKTEIQTPYQTAPNERVEDTLWENKVIDHIIIGKTSYSFANAGKLPTKK